MRRAIVLVLTLVLAAVALGAQPAPTPEERLANSIPATLAGGSMRVSGTIAVDTEGFRPATFDGALTADGRDGEITFVFNSLLPLAPPMVTRVVDGTSFLELSSLADSVGVDLDDLGPELASKIWVRVTPADLGQTGTGGPGSDPAAQLAMVRAMRDVEDLGFEDVAGEPATHLRGIVNLRRALREAPRADRRRLREAFAQLGSQRIPVDVWLDATDRLRRFDMQFEAPTIQVDVLASVTYTDYGVPIAVERPARGEVVSYDEFLSAVRASILDDGEN